MKTLALSIFLASASILAPSPRTAADGNRYTLRNTESTARLESVTDITATEKWILVADTAPKKALPDWAFNNIVYRSTAGTISWDIREDLGSKEATGAHRVGKKLDSCSVDLNKGVMRCKKATIGVSPNHVDLFEERLVGVLGPFIVYYGSLYDKKISPPAPREPAAAPGDTRSAR